MILKALTTLALAVAGANAAANQLQQVTNFGSNPTNVGMYVYKPTKLASPLPLIVGMHYCTGTAQAYFTGTQYANLADQYGFIVIYPNAPDSGGCWDVHTNATLTHNAGGDSLGIASMVRYAISTYGVDANHVFATGTSSGAMMTNVLMGAYPDLFQAGSAFSGVPYGCFEGSDMWNSQCAEGLVIKTPQEWGDLVRSGYPGYTGPRPKFQFWHGTADTTLYPQNFWEDIKQWTNVFGVSQTPVTNTTNDPLPGYSWATFGPNVDAILAQGVGHTVPVRESDVLNWFGITNSGSGGTTTTSTAPPTTSSPASGTVAHYGQCGGIGYTGSTVCAAPYTCQVSNSYYSQCL
ncbi:carbohydrate-binding module family 1 protein [Hydnomerulius pinastri MD-312]|uniref:Carboxylic ester hydrolase n=1 Tax=Hydnomerulius pinastri MD-312 TaxID=994086 RepID=A0A0C9W8K3_9AGAM|nr:carbohydrate-binding module family 1 protein [Hydnomerulius pinastri MD-312]